MPGYFGAVWLSLSATQRSQLSPGTITIIFCLTLLSPTLFLLSYAFLPIILSSLLSIWPFIDISKLDWNASLLLWDELTNHSMRFAIFVSQSSLGYQCVGSSWTTATLSKMVVLVFGVLECVIFMTETSLRQLDNWMPLPNRGVIKLT